MKKTLLIAVIAILFFNHGYGQSLWNSIPEERLSNHEKVDRVSIPSEYKLYSLDFTQLKNLLAQAPSRGANTVSNLVIEFPTPEGKLEHYRIFEASVMDPALAIRYPEIQSYVGTSIEDPTATMRFSTTLFGLHTMTLSAKSGTTYIDPFTKDLNNYIVYNKKDLTTTQTFRCLVTEDPINVTSSNGQRPAYEAFASDSFFRKYRLAMACTIEYAAFHVNAAGLASGTLAQKKAAVLAAMNVTMTRVNGVYERDISVTMQLVANNDVIIFITSDSFNNNNANTLIDQSQTVINSAIGAANYDIGHTVSTGGGGLAQLNVPCTSSKARGITGSPQPVGDPFNIDYVAHEMGHQFGASHTFNGEGGSCDGNRSQQQAVEPGSGSTIMAYAGICAANVQDNSDSYFHAVSLEQMRQNITSTTCQINTPNNNTPPVIDDLTSYTIPKGTAFILKGNGSDADGDALTYCWEQTNPGGSNPLNLPTASTTASVPNFRSVSPSISPNRYMPNFTRVLNGTLAASAAWEIIPNVARTMNFALTVRDNRTPNGGQTARKNMTVTFNGTAGPFAVTAPTESVTWPTGSTQTVTWNIAGTTENGINTTNVKISFSNDGGTTFTTLIESTPNDGSEAITIPAGPASISCRIMVEAVGNIYYAISRKFFTSSLSNEDFSLADFNLYPNPNRGNFTVQFNSNSSKAITLEVHDIRGRQIFNKSYNNSGLFSEKLQLNNAQSGIYLLTVNDGDKKVVRKIVVE